jgi:hypothetical protein
MGTHTPLSLLIVGLGGVFPSGNFTTHTGTAIAMAPKVPPHRNGGRPSKGYFLFRGAKTSKRRLPQSDIYLYFIVVAK